MTYDNLGRLLTRTYPDGGVESFGYSARGLIAYTNQIGLRHLLRLRRCRAARPSETNANGEVTPLQLQRLWGPAHADRRQAPDHPLGLRPVWPRHQQARPGRHRDPQVRYDADNRLTNRWSAAKGNTAYAYDFVGNLTNINYPASPDVTLQYDWLNRLTNMVDAAGTTKYSYMAGNQLLTEDGPFTSDIVTNTYQNRLRVALSLQQPTGAWTNGFAYDAARRLTNVTSQAGAFTNVYGTGVGGSSGFSSRLIQRELLANGSAITNSFDSVARLLGTYLRTSAGVLTNKHEYLYNAASQRTNETRMDGSTVAYAYDNIGQLKVANSSVYAENRGYAYDRAWNLTNYTINSSSGTYLVNNLNELTNEVGGYSLSYDANGNLAPNFGGYYNYSYDDENRLTQMSDNVYRQLSDATPSLCMMVWGGCASGWSTCGPACNGR